MVFIDAPSTSWIDSITSPKVKTMEGQGVGARSLVHSTSEVEGCARASGWGLGRVKSESIFHMDLHKPNNKLLSVQLEHFLYMGEPWVNTESQDSS
jgi:hypothetical protein